jgi:response regulator RpfG family c-di-GMP phosphodiesterase
MEERTHVLFVDDEERIVRLLRVMFRERYEVFTALGGEEALTLMQTQRIDVLVCDQRMPGMLGHELLAKVRVISPHTVRLLLTGYSDLVAIIGAINEGEVYRFLNKPWNQDELRAVVAEAAELAHANRLQANQAAADLSEASPPLASAAGMLAWDGVANDRLEVMEMFTQDFHVIGAATAEEALSVLQQHHVGVVVVNPHGNEEDAVDLLTMLSDAYPLVALVVVSEAADSRLLIKLINQAKIYRFAMKPISPNLFRLAVSAAMKEHHRRLADPRLVAKAKSVAASQPNGEFGPVLMKSLARFNDIW